MKKMCTICILTFMLALASCKKKEEIILPGDDVSSFSYEEGKIIPIADIEIPYSQFSGNIEAFRRYEKPIDDFGLEFKKSSRKTHQIIFVFDASYPIKFINLKTFQDKNIKPISEISIDISLDGYGYQRVINNKRIGLNEILPIDGQLAKKIKLTFKADGSSYGLLNCSFALDKGFIVKEAQDWSNLFLRYSGWTGADGIFSFNLNGKRKLWEEKSKSLLIFSDTFIGDVYTHNHLRKSSKMINNSIGYIDHSKPLAQSIQFNYKTVDGVAKSIFGPSYYIGKEARNLFDSDGLSISQSKDALLQKESDGTMYLTDQKQAMLEIDFKKIVDLAKIYVWNYNDNPNFGSKKIKLLFSDDQNTWREGDSFFLPKASGLDSESFNKEIHLGQITARYVRLELEEGYSDEYIGLGKLMFFDSQNNYLFGQISGTLSNFELSDLDKTARLWLQDGVIIDNYLYLFPLLVKDFETYFKVHSVGFIKTPIVNQKLDYENAIMMDSPLYFLTSNQEEIFFGAGIMDNTDIDGYIYIYGYKDANSRSLVVSRVLPKDIENFNEYEYYDGTNWQNDIKKVATLKDSVSAELSVTYIPQGEYAGKYMLVVMENTLSGTISYALSDTPYGSFGPYNKIYQFNDYRQLKSAFSYNAKLHPHLSDEGRFLISYNVNSMDMASLSDVRIYYPRFVEMIEVKGKG